MKATATAIELLISGPEGYIVDLFAGLLSVGRLENGQYAVRSTRGTDQIVDEALFDHPGDAASAFIHQREVRRLGYDFEAPDAQG